MPKVTIATDDGAIQEKTVSEQDARYYDELPFESSNVSWVSIKRDEED